MIIQIADPTTATEWIYYLAGVVGGLGSLATFGLVILYLFQHHSLEEQTKLSRINQTPYLNGPYKFGYNTNTGKYEMLITNAGSGVAEDIEMKTYLRIVDDNIRIEGGRGFANINRKDTNFLDKETIQPNESEVRFELDPTSISIKVVDNTKEPPEDGTYSIPNALPTLETYGIEMVQIGLYIEYADRFGNEEDPFGRKYVISGPYPAFSTMHPKPNEVFRLESNDIK